MVKIFTTTQDDIVEENRPHLSIIAREKEITYEELRNECCVPTPPGMALGRNVMFDDDLKTLEAEGYINRTDDLITYIRR